MFPLSTPLPLKNYLYYPKKEILQGSDFRTFAEIRKNSYNEAAKEVGEYEKSKDNRRYSGIDCFFVGLCEYGSPTDDTG